MLRSLKISAEPRSLVDVSGVSRVHECAKDEVNSGAVGGAFNDEMVQKHGKSCSSSEHSNKGATRAYLPFTHLDETDAAIPNRSETFNAISRNGIGLRSAVF